MSPLRGPHPSSVPPCLKRRARISLRVDRSSPTWRIRHPTTPCAHLIIPCFKTVSRPARTTHARHLSRSALRDRHGCPSLLAWNA